MPVVSVVVDDVTVRTLDDIRKSLSEEVGFEVNRSDILRQAIREFIENSN